MIKIKALQRHKDTRMAPRTGDGEMYYIKMRKSREGQKKKKRKKDQDRLRWLLKKQQQGQKLSAAEKKEIKVLQISLDAS